MNKNKLGFYDKLSSQVLENLKRNNIDSFYFKIGKEAKEKVLGMIPQGATVGMAGSLTLREIGLIDELMQGNWKVFNPYLTELSREESLRIRRDGVWADYFLSGTNAITLKGELINISAMGNKIAGLSYGKKVIIVAGINKIVKDVKEGIERTRNLVAPMNAQRLDFNTPCKETAFCDYDLCRPPDYDRMCNQLLVIEGERDKGRLTVILVGEELGF